MMLVIQTQDHENYAWREDGTLGVGADAYWKAKGGEEFKVLGISRNHDLDAIVEAVRPSIEIFNDAFRSEIISWSIESDDYLSDFERSQLKYEGSISYPAKTIDYQDLKIAGA